MERVTQTTLPFRAVGPVRTVRYRVVRDGYSGFECQKWRLWWPWWTQMNFSNTHPTLERAVGYIRRDFDGTAPKLNQFDDQGRKHGPWVQVTVHSLDGHDLDTLTCEYLHGLMHGELTKVSSRGPRTLDVRVRTYERGVPHGPFRLDVSHDDLVSETVGRYDRGLMHGPWTCKSNGGTSYSGRYERGMREGTWEYLFDLTRTARIAVEFANDLRHGAHRAFGRDGGLIAAGSYVRGRRVGTWEWFGDDGKVSRRGRFERGMKVGLWEDRLAGDRSPETSLERTNERT